ncbi:MAG: cysteine desulfurase [Elusimicrobia bacterium]|nr:cysteine desulfurase [Candidatus Obscuribacterium magneticum]
MTTIYLDHNATAPLYPEVLEAMRPYLSNEFGNPSSLHQLGQRARKAVEEARAQMAAFIGADDPSEIVFTSGGTESDNLAIQGMWAVSQQKGKRVVSSNIEHAAVRQVLRQMAASHQIDLTLVPVEPDGIVRGEDVEKSITPDTILISIMTANNEIGTLQPIPEIAELCRRKNIPFHTDAVQAAGKMRIRVNEMGGDLLSLSGHKFGGPKGVGILYVRRGTRLMGMIHGGRQEKNWRGGTENVAGIVGMAKAADITRKNLGREIIRLKNLRDKFEHEILARIPDTHINGDTVKRLPNTSNIRFDDTDNTAMVMALDLAGISVSNGSACASGSPEPSHVLLALGLPQHQAHACIRFSLGSTTTEKDMDETLRILPRVVAKLREIKVPL